MTDHTKSAGDVEAREAAALEIAKYVLDDAGINNLSEDDPSGTILDVTNLSIDAYLAKLTSTKPEPSRIAEVQALLLDEAKRHSDFTKSMQARRKAEYIERGETAPDYRGMEPEETIYWEAATIITAIEADRDALQSDKDRLTKALERARTYVEMSYDENGGEEAAEAKHDLKEIDLALSPPSTSQSEGEG